MSNTLTAFLCAAVVLSALSVVGVSLNQCEKRSEIAMLEDDDCHAAWAHYLRHARIVDVKRIEPISFMGTDGGAFELVFEDGRHAMFKSCHKPKESFLSELLAYHVDRALQIRRTPAVVSRAIRWSELSSLRIVRENATISAMLQSIGLLCSNSELNMHAFSRIVSDAIASDALKGISPFDNKRLRRYSADDVTFRGVAIGWIDRPPVVSVGDWYWTHALQQTIDNGESAASAAQSVSPSARWMFSRPNHHRMVRAELVRYWTQLFITNGWEKLSHNAFAAHLGNRARIMVAIDNDRARFDVYVPLGRNATVCDGETRRCHAPSAWYHFYTHTDFHPDTVWYRSHTANELFGSVLRYACVWPASLAERIEHLAAASSRWPISQYVLEQLQKDRVLPMAAINDNLHLKWNLFVVDHRLRDLFDALKDCYARYGREKVLDWSDLTLSPPGEDDDKSGRA